MRPAAQPNRRKTKFYIGLNTIVFFFYIWNHLIFFGYGNKNEEFYLQLPPNESFMHNEMYALAIK